jgi:hypothetical protein
MDKNVYKCVFVDMPVRTGGASSGQAHLASASDAIQKMQNRGAIGKKRKSVKC